MKSKVEIFRHPPNRPPFTKGLPHCAFTTKKVDQQFFFKLISRTNLFLLIPLNYRKTANDFKDYVGLLHAGCVFLSICLHC